MGRLAMLSEIISSINETSPRPSSLSPGLPVDGTLVDSTLVNGTLVAGTLVDATLLAVADTLVDTSCCDLSLSL